MALVALSSDATVLFNADGMELSLTLDGEERERGRERKGDGDVCVVGAGI